MLRFLAPVLGFHSRGGATPPPRRRLACWALSSAAARLQALAMTLSRRGLLDRHQIRTALSWAAALNRQAIRLLRRG